MARPHVYIKHPHPLITPRIEFLVAPRPDQPIITPRIDFGVRGLNVRGTPPDPMESFVASRSRQSPSARQGEQSSGAKKALSRNAKVKVLIPKPPGEPGRPKCGGFSLEPTLKQHGWDDSDIELFMSDIREACKNLLDTTVSFSKQKEDLVQQICDEMSAPDSWPILVDYENCWPVVCALKLVLKYAAEASRRKSGRNEQVT